MGCGTPPDTLLESGAEGAWDELFARYSAVISTVCRSCRVFGSDADDVAGTVWLRLVANLARIREPKAVPKWLVTTTRRECLLLLRQKRKRFPNDATGEVVPAVEEPLLSAERTTAVREALAGLSDRDRTLLALLFSDPPTPYKTISARLGMPIGAIGPTRQRCLAQVRRAPSIAALVAT